ncbi:MAG: hypothetical protein ACTHNH_08340 [Mesorhizobium sp.]
MTSARVIVDGEAYKVSSRQLQLLEKGKTPADLMLEPERIEGDGRNTLENSAL